jgi:thymidylate synthase
MERNKYFDLLRKIIKDGHNEKGSKADLIALYNESLSFSRDELIELFLQYKLPMEKLTAELELYLRGEEETNKYPEWWGYIGSKFKNSYPQYFCILPKLIDKINSGKQSKNYVLYLGSTLIETNQLPCVSLMQFQIYAPRDHEDKRLYMTVYQRSADANLGLPADLYQAYLISEKIKIPLENLTFFYGNVHIYWNNLFETENMLDGDVYRFTLNV